ncbi:pheromone Phb2.2 B43 [Coprinopsis cinerea okayama7|uniref:Pheromone Phb2.2 B43 n=2 Tax=Coprinopsis cinerea TaxID=5346 RepID=A8NKB1_COPC7|nr:pheromone Phb2.2 B43 [Coprinopsis cinerea okayama7\|eukprot:XP_001834398.2 pheromone Phb2.2 B43 [Coprinopsis cinerea okayama7\
MASTTDTFTSLDAIRNDETLTLTLTPIPTNEPAAAPSTAAASSEVPRNFERPGSGKLSAFCIIA